MRNPAKQGLAGFLGHAGRRAGCLSTPLGAKQAA